MPLRIAAIEFLNAAPLMWGLDGDDRFELSYTVPSACADALRAGAADLGVIPVIELARIPGLVGLGEIGVAAADGEQAEVRSILLISRCPASAIRTVALDRASRTSAALVQILLKHHFQAESTPLPGEANWRRSLERADAVLVIGDPALQARIAGPGSEFHVYDLAREWRAWTGLPFVFAVWGIRAPRFAEARHWLPARLHQSLRDGLAAREQLVQAWAPRLQLPPLEIRRYLSENVTYELTPAHVRGLRRFLDLSAAEGWLPAEAIPGLLISDEADGRAGAA